ncbi:cytosine permease [Burkholderia sp. BCC0419]|uniref:cytosine permease n=1 Tax=Burkholderia sp. BCC0419 TaxID=486878 RepID=UPI0015898576|nr:cytosine permease [Burkholderia sp. BCC0419]
MKTSNTASIGNAATGADSDQDYSTSEVAQSATVSGWRIGLILVGVMIALPAFMMGAELSHSLGAAGAIAASFGGGVILMLIALPAAFAGARSRLSTYMLIIDAFGSVGGRVINVLLSLSLLGWFGVIAMMFGDAMRSVAPAALADVTATAWATIGCVLMIATNFIGFKALDRLSALTTPLKIALLGWSSWTAIQHYGSAALTATASTGSYSVATGISIVVGGIAVGSVLMPDICRYARTPRHALFACFLAFALGFPLILVLAGIPSLATGEHDLVPIMLKLGLGLPAIAVILLAAWSTNTYNLYASTLVWSTVTTTLPRWQLALAAGLIGSAAGLFGLSGQLTQYLIVLSIGIPPIGGVYLCNYYLSLRNGRGNTDRWHVKAFAAWGIGIAGAAAQMTWHFTLTSVPALDSLGVAAVTYLILRRIGTAR